MSHDDAPVEPVSTDAPNEPALPTRREAVREKAEQVRVQQTRSRWMRRGALGIALVAACAVVVSVVYVTVDSAISAPDRSPSNSTADRGFAVTSVPGALSEMTADDVPAAAAPAESDEAAVQVSGEASASATPTTAPPVEIAVYVDYLSEGAKEWQIANSAQLSGWVGDGAITLTYYPVSMLAAKSNGTKYSLRAASAAACVASFSPDQFFAYNEALLQRQPSVDAPGFSDTELADLAQASGIEKITRVRGCIEDGAYQSWVRKATEEAVVEIPDTDGLALTGTPTIVVNGEKYAGALGDAAEFSQFVMTSSSGKFYKDQLATPTPTPTPTP